ncbi:MAG: response regulator [Anaerolineae bacterium]|nr:response regulator [Anaerolineae bacterium]
MDLPLSKIDIHEDLLDDRRQYLGWMLLGTWLTAQCAFVWQWNNHSALFSDLDIVPWVILAATLMISFLLRQKNHIQVGGWVFIVGYIATVGFHLCLNAPQIGHFVLLLLPIGFAAVLLRDEDISTVAILVVIAMLGATLINGGLSLMMSTAVLPAIVIGITAMFFYVKANTVMDTVRWALDVKVKDERRAEAFFKQGEELKEANLHNLKVNSALEQMNADLAEANRKTEEISKAKSVFLSNISHELRTPLNVIIGYSSSLLNMPQMFQNVPVPEAHRPYLELIEANGHYLVGLINDILDLSKIAAGKFELHQASTDLSEICRGVMQTSLGLLKGKPIQIRLDIPEHLPPVWADATRVRQVLLNLLSNAVKFTNSGSITIRVEPMAETLKVSVIDTGIGIPPAALASIFDRFEQAKQDKSYGGTGLGLDISKQLCQMHGGDLTVESEVGKGSIFSFTLTIDHAAVANAQPQAEMISDEVKVFSTEADSYDAPPMVLVVEDDDGTRQLLREVLESGGYYVTETNSGAQAIELAYALMPALVILDAQLPDMNGWDVLAELKANPDTSILPIAMCTVDEDRRTETDASGVYYVPKPVTAQQLLRCAEQALSVSTVTE